MKLNRTNIVLATLLVIVVWLGFMTRVDYSQPNVEILPDMKYTPAWTAYAKNPNFPNGRTLQAPVAGTIARGRMPLHFNATPEDAVRAGEELINPFQNGPTDENQEAAAEAAKRLQESVRRGGDAFRVFCVCCHGSGGMGDGPVTKRGFPPPPSLITGKSRQMKDGQLFHLLTFGQASMPEFRNQLTAERRWDVINFIRSLQAKAPADEPVQQPAEQGNAPAKTQANDSESDGESP